MNETKNIAYKLGERIRDIRKSKNLSQEHVAFSAEISSTFLGQVERGNKKPTIETLVKISKALDVEIIDLFNFNTPLNIVDDNEQNKSIVAINTLLKSMDEESVQEVLKVLKSMINFKNIKSDKNKV